MEQRKEFELDLFFNVVEPDWKGYPQQGRVHFRKQSCAMLEPEHFFSMLQPAQQDASPEGRELFTTMFGDIGYPHLIDKDV